MIRKYLLPFVAVLGVMLAVYTVVAGQRTTPPAQPVTQPAQPQFNSYVAGAGIVEASTENIAVGTFVPGVVTEIFVKFGDHVKAGDPLFRIDDRDLRAELVVRQAAERSAQAREKTEAASLADVKNQLEMWLGVNNTGAVSKDEVDRKRFAVQIQDANSPKRKRMRYRRRRRSRRSRSRSTAGWSKLR
jgi:multidrug efflux pump subunit AcrA (membrane-fusion protein)